ncbi:MAG TPA: hypothetical protein VNZ56_09030 [Verrucomicrobiae bacterium]|jgi:hypothetical protein|nr:hypothetical protein [Verrucomicrobiae bacterium]
MNHLEAFLDVGILMFQIMLCGFLYTRKVQRVLPLFTAYGTTMLVTTVLVLTVYEAAGSRSRFAYFTYWIFILLIAAVRSLAVAELCRYKLRSYPGIWGLGWRVLAGLSILFVVHAAIDTWGQPNALAIYSLTLDVDLDMASVAILVALLLFHNYYRLSLEPLQRTIAAGICFICAVDIVSDTIVRNYYAGPLFSFFTEQRTSHWYSQLASLDRINHIWDVVHLSCFMATLGIWCYGLRKPVVAPGRAELLPAEVYRELSPAINLRLSTFNDKLVELLKP